MNITIVLGLLLVLLGTNIGSYVKGTHVGRDEARATYAGELERTLAAKGEEAARDTARAVKRAAEDAAAKTKASMLRTKTSEVLRAKPMPAECDWNDDAFGLLISAIGTAAGSANTPGSVPNTVPSADRTGK